MHFNSHAHVERDENATDNTNMVKISTHTLTWSVTQTEKLTQYVNRISTHTLTWSVTNMNGFNVNMTKISTHTLTWSVTRTWEDFDFTLNISTHTLTWSVTTQMKQNFKKL